MIRRSILGSSLILMVITAWWLARPDSKTALLPTSRSEKLPPEKTFLPIQSSLQPPGIEEKAAPTPVELLPVIESLVLLASENPASAAIQALKSHSSDDSHRLLLEVLPFWGESAPEEALIWILNQESLVTERRAELLESVLSAWAWQDPVSASTWLEKHLTAEYGSSILSLMAAWSNQAPEAALTWISKHLDTSWRQKLLMDLLPMFPSSSARSVLTAGISAETVDRALAYGSTSVAQHDAPTAALMIKSIQDQDLQTATADGVLRKIAATKETTSEVIAKELGLETMTLLPRLLPPPGQAIKATDDQSLDSVPDQLPAP